MRTNFGVRQTDDGSVDTSDLERAHDIMRRVYRLSELTADCGPDGAPVPPFRFRRTVLGEERFALGRFLYSGRVEAVSEPLPFVVVGQLHAGAFDVETAEHSLRGVPRQPFVLPDHLRKRVRFSGLDLGQVMVDRGALDDELRGLRLLPPGGHRFVGFTPTSAAAVQHWQALSSHVYRDVLGNDEAWASPLVRGSVFRMLVAALLSTFPSNALTAADEPDPSPLPQTVRRALAFIEEHAAEDVGVVEIAAAARLTPRGLQLAFRRHLDTTPLAALREERLRRAHADLVEGSPARGDTVLAIAARWGFSHQGRFAAAYQEAYGRPPRSTLEA